jgi:hypothetical protein
MIGPHAGIFVWFGFGLVWVGLGWNSGWDCARGIFPPGEYFPPDPPLNSRAELEKGAGV